MSAPPHSGASGLIGLWTFDDASGLLAADASPLGVHATLGEGSGTEPQWTVATPLAGVQVSRLGTPPNPAALLPDASSGPVLGSPWAPSIDHTSFLPSSVLDVLALGATPTNIPSELGTILTFPALASFLTAPGVPFSIPIPSDCSLVGAALVLQGVSWDGGSTIALTNALDTTIGSF